MKSDSDSISALQPLKPQDYMILFVLLGEELHGYRMVKEIAKQSDGEDPFGGRQSLSIDPSHDQTGFTRGVGPSAGR